ncbi:NUDIX domain-containing protein [Micropruina sp.]|uniref:NUDIX domain-containing protein n=1 Tax=Micropruina sp. TaxID=2737536 RepID=UPI0039E599CE
MTPRIRNIAVGLVVRDGRVLAEEHAVVPGHHRFARAIGGGIEFGERAEQALRREFREELGVELTSRTARRDGKSVRPRRRTRS